MYSRTSVGPRIEPWETPGLTGYSCEDFPSRGRQACQTLSKALDSSSSCRPVKNPSNSIRYNCKKNCSWSSRPKTILEIRKRPHFSR